MLAGDAEVRICQKKCVTVDALSDKSNYKCSTPPIATIKSNDQFLIREESILYGDVVIYGGMEQSMALRVFDN